MPKKTEKISYWVSCLELTRLNSRRGYDEETGEECVILRGNVKAVLIHKIGVDYEKARYKTCRYIRSIMKTYRHKFEQEVFVSDNVETQEILEDVKIYKDNWGELLYVGRCDYLLITELGMLGIRILALADA